jgi:hypothetical protein
MAFYVPCGATGIILGLMTTCQGRQDAGNHAQDFTEMTHRRHPLLDTWCSVMLGQ